MPRVGAARRSSRTSRKAPRPTLTMRMDENTPEPTREEVVRSLRLKAFYWRQEAERFAGRPEERWCIDYAEHAETLAELERLRVLD